MPDTLIVPCNGLQQLPQAAASIIAFAEEEKIWLFEGEVGAGKTTLIKAICAVFGIQDLVNSPTFALVNEYHNKEDDIFYHFDFYRIQDAEEALDIGIEEYFYSGHYCFVEWPSHVEALLPEHYLSIRIDVAAENGRRIYLEKI